MKKINEMTEQEILAMTEEDVQKLIKLHLMEQGIKLLEKPKKPELFEIEPADIECYTIPLLDGFAFTNREEAEKVQEALRNATSLRKVEYDWNKFNGEYKYLEKKKRYSYKGESDFAIQSMFVYSPELYNKIVDFVVQNKAMVEQVAKDQQEYDENLKNSADAISEIRQRVSDIRNKYARLDDLSRRFAVDYYPLSDNNEEMAIKFLEKAYSLTEEEKEYILNKYNKYLE